VVAPRETVVMQDSAPARTLDFSPEPLSPPGTAVPDPGPLRLWFGVLGAPVSWMLQLLVIYPLVELACRWATDLPLYVLSLVLFAVAALAGLVSWRSLQTVRHRNGATMPRRIRFMARAGLASSALFALAIGAGTLPVAFDDPCQLQGGPRGRTVLPHL
jgi:hypothetical protein